MLQNNWLSWFELEMCRKHIHKNCCFHNYDTVFKHKMVINFISDFFSHSEFVYIALNMLKVLGMLFLYVVKPGCGGNILVVSI